MSDSYSPQDLHSGAPEADAPKGERFFRIRPIPERFLPVYAAVWWTLAVATLVSLLAGLAFIIQDFQEPTTGPLGIMVDDDSGSVVVIDAFGTAREAGLRAEMEEILAVDGQDITAAEDPYLAFFELANPVEGGTVELLIKDVDGEQKTITLPALASNTEAAFAGSGLSSQSDFVLNLIIFGIFYFGMLIAAFLLFGRRREVVPQILAIGVLLFLAGSSLVIGFVPLWIERLHGLAAPTGFTLILVGLLLFPDGRFVPRWSIVFAVVMLLLLAYEYTNPLPDWLVLVVDIGFPLAVFAAMVVRYRRIEDVEQQQQMRWAFFGITIGTLLFAGLTVVEEFADVLMPGRFWDIWYRHTIGLVGVLGTLFMLGGVIVSLLRLRLYDVDSIISRSAAVALVTLMMIALFAGVEEVVSKLGEQYFSTTAGLVASGIGAGVAAMVIIPLHERVQSWAERRFQGMLVALRIELQDKVTDLRETAELETLVAEVSDRLMHVLHAQRVACVIEQDGKLNVFEPRMISAAEAGQFVANTKLGSAESLQRFDSDLLFPARLPLVVEEIGADRQIGWILLGPRPDGSFYNREECDALNDIASPVARSIDVVQRRSKLDRDRLARIETLETKLRDLETRVGDGTASAG